MQFGLGTNGCMENNVFGKAQYALNMARLLNKEVAELKVENDLLYRTIHMMIRYIDDLNLQINGKKSGIIDHLRGIGCLK